MAKEENELILNYEQLMAVFGELNRIKTASTLHGAKDSAEWLVEFLTARCKGEEW